MVLLFGGADSDTFVFANGDGLDTISDFSLIESDLIQLSGYTVESLTALAALFSEDGGDTLITFDALNVVTIKSIASGNLDEDNFLFV